MLQREIIFADIDSFEGNDSKTVGEGTLCDIILQILRTVELPNPAAQLPSLDPPFVLHSELWIIMMIMKLTNE